MTNGPIWTKGARAIAECIASGAISSRDAIEAHIRRIESIGLNAVCVARFEEALLEAAAVDDAIGRGETPGPLGGVPVTVKESFDVAGLPTTAGLSRYRDTRASKDSDAVAALRRAGAIVIAKTNVSQLLLGNESDNPLYGRTTNPWDVRRSPGGSSGGEAALIAAGGSPLGLGSDIGGSVRLPASACGVHALKPTAGRISMRGHFDCRLAQGTILPSAGPIAREVRDLILAMSVLTSGSGSPTPGDVRGLRVGVYVENGVMTPSPALVRATRDAASALAAAGAEVIDWKPPDPAEGWDIYLRLLLSDRMRAARALLHGSVRGAQIRMFSASVSLPPALLRAAAGLARFLGQRRTAASLDRIEELSPGQLALLIARRDAYRTRFLEAMNHAGLDAIATCTDAFVALPHGASRFLGDALSHAALFNLLDFPAGIIAATRVAQGEESERPWAVDGVEWIARGAEGGTRGLPAGVQIAARAWREDIVLSIMLELETRFRLRPDYPTTPITP